MQLTQQSLCQQNRKIIDVNMFNISKILFFTIGLTYTSSVSGQIVKPYLNNFSALLASSSLNFKRFVFSSDDFMVSFEIPHKLNRINNELDIEKFNQKFDFTFRVEKSINTRNRLYLTDSNNFNLIKVETFFAYHNLNLEEKKSLPFSRHDKKKYIEALLNVMKCELVKIKIGNSILPLFNHESGHFQYPYSIITAIICHKTNRKKMYFINMNIEINHLMTINFQCFSNKASFTQMETYNKIAKSVRLHKFTFSNTSLFDAFENNSGFLR